MSGLLICFQIPSKGETHKYAIAYQSQRIELCISSDVALNGSEYLHILTWPLPRMYCVLLSGSRLLMMNSARHSYQVPTDGVYRLFLGHLRHAK